MKGEGKQGKGEGDFYAKAKKQYDIAVKPFMYEFHLTSTQPKPRKFTIILNKLQEVIRTGMKPMYIEEDDMSQNYWEEFEKEFKGSIINRTTGMEDFEEKNVEWKYYHLHQEVLENENQVQVTCDINPGFLEMKYISENVHDKKKNKLKIFYTLLLNNKNLFDIIKNRIVRKLAYLYQNPVEKAATIEKDLECLKYLENGQFEIISQNVSQFEKMSRQFRENKISEYKIELFKAKQLKEKKNRGVNKIFELLYFMRKDRIQSSMIKIQTNKVRAIAKPKAKPDLVTPEIKPTKISPHQEQFMTPFHEKKKHSHSKNSDLLFKEKFEDDLEIFSFHLKPEESKKKTNCYRCNAPLSQGLYFFGGNINLCEYTGQWYCNECIAEERISIPWRACQSFDLRGYSVSKQSYAEIKQLYEKPIIEISSDSEVVKSSRKLYDFLVLKRQLHLMYDSICNSLLIEKLLIKKLNYCLKKNLFSLKNLYDIYNGHQGPSLERQCSMLVKHFYKCEVCQIKKGYTCGKCNYPPKIFPFQLKTTHGCKICRKLYHRACLTNGQCDCMRN